MFNLKERLSLAILAFVVIAAVFGPIAFRQSTAAAQDSIAGQTDIGLQRRQVVALERIARELATANRNARRCR